MLQSFAVTSRPEQGPPRLARLRDTMAEAGLDAWIVPRADAHQGEYVAPCDERLAWLTGFTGSAGYAVVTADEAAVFADGRYRVQARAQVAAGSFEIVAWPATRPADWLKSRLPERGRVGFDPWLHSVAEIRALAKALGDGAEAVPCENLVDRIWTDRPPRPRAPVTIYPDQLAGETHDEKRSRLAAELEKSGRQNAILTLPDSICWLLNIRGGDIPRIPIVHGFAILEATGRVQLFTDAELGPEALEHLGDAVALHPYDGLVPHLLAAENGVFRLDPSSAPHAVLQALEANGTVEIAEGADPCQLPKAAKNPAEIMATREAHLRDGAAMCEFLAWLDAEVPKGGLTEIDVVAALEGFRTATNVLRDISFETIAGSGPNGAIVHYRVSEETNRPISPGELLLVDSGGQYLDGTTDITRTVAVGSPPAEAVRAFTRVLQGMIAVSRARFPRGLAGRDLDALARAPLWSEGWDYDHGTGHGVGVFLSVHEGPQRLSRQGEVAFEPGMIVSNEPGYYRDGAFGIRTENLIVVIEAPKIGDGRDQLAFETLTHVPIDLRLIDAALLSPEERGWLDAYHAETRARLSGRLSDGAARWLDAATRPL